MAVAIRRIPGGLFSTYLLVDEVKKMSVYIAKYDSNGKKTRAAIALDKKLDEQGPIQQAKDRDERDIQRCSRYLVRLATAEAERKCRVKQTEENSGEDDNGENGYHDESIANDKKVSRCAGLRHLHFI